MGGFNNQIIGGLSKLIRQAIQSPNYVAGLLGWSINKDGSAEFSDVKVRGTMTLNNASDAILVYDVNGDLIFAITQDSSTLPAHTSNPIVFGDHLGTGAGAFGVLSFKTQHTSDWDMFVTELGGIPLLHTNYVGNGSPIDLAFGSASSHGTIANGIMLAARYPDVVPGSPGPSKWQFGTGFSGGAYYEEMDLSAQVVPSGVAFAPLVNLTPVWGVGTNNDYPTAFNLVTGTWTCPETGIYSHMMSSAFVAWVSGSRLLMTMSRNGTAAVNTFSKWDNPDNSGAHQLVNDPMLFQAGDTVVFRVGQVTGVNQTIVSGTDERSRLAVYRHF